MLVDDIRAVPISFPVPPERSVRLGIGRSFKRDAVLVRVTTDEGHVGWGDAHHGRAPGAIARLVDTTLRELLIGRDACDVTPAMRCTTYKQVVHFATIAVCQPTTTPPSCCALLPSSRRCPRAS